VRCSSCELLLDEFVEATLDRARAIAVGAHLRGCTACEALHRRLRIVDALLTTARGPDLHPEFTPGLMAHVRVLPAPAISHRPLLALAAFYLVAAWIFVGAALSFAGPRAPAVAREGARLAGGILATLGQGAHALWPMTPVALSVVVGVLSIDVLLFAAVVVFYRTVRPQLAARLAVNAEVR
jgi:hypothetical protein